MEGELEFNELELACFETPNHFRDFLVELDEEYDINDVTEMIDYFHQKSIDYMVYIQILKQFKKEKGI